MDEPYTLESSCFVYLKPKGEICNRLSAGTQIRVIQRKDGWFKVTWRNGKKKGWILPEKFKNLIQ